MKRKLMICRALLIIWDGQAYARLLWSSTYYDYMILGDEYYYNQSEDNGNSTFVIPITAMDEPIPVIADTTAMGDPAEIHYKLTFYEESIGPKGQIPQETAKKVLIIAGIIIVAGWFLNYYVKKKRRERKSVLQSGGVFSMGDYPFFPVFIDLSGKKVLVIGAEKIARKGNLVASVTASGKDHAAAR